MKETGWSCGRNSKHWKLWLEGLGLIPDVDEKCEILCAEIEDADGCEPPMTILESSMGLPPPADEDRHVGLVLYHEHSLGGPTQSKLRHGSVHFEDWQCSEALAGALPLNHISAFREELLTEASTRFAMFLGVDFAEVDEHRFSRTSLEVEGWACAKVLDGSDLAGSCEGDSPCCAFGGR